MIAGRWPSPVRPPLTLTTKQESGRGVNPNRPLTIIGTGEYAYPPFRMALALEEEGHDVYFQSTTRSPILVGDAIASRREFPDHHGDGVPNYLYNLDPSRLPVVVYEHPALAAAHGLPSLIDGLALTGEE